jgi:hypothetical protein
MDLSASLAPLGEGKKAGIGGETASATPETIRQLPDDLPKSLDDRRNVHSYGGETEIYDAWQGTSVGSLWSERDRNGIIWPQCERRGVIC